MFIICNEAKALKIFEKYKQVAAFTMSKSPRTVTVCEQEVTFKKLPFMLSEDDINAVKNGDIKLKKVIKRAVKALYDPKPENGIIGLNVTQVIGIITANRNSKRGPAIIVFITDDQDEERNKILTKYVKALFAEFGLEPLSNKTCKKIFKGGKKKVKSKVIKQSRRKGCALSANGTTLKELNYTYYELELQQNAMSNEGYENFGKERQKLAVKYLTNVFTATNLKKLSDKGGKRMSKKDKFAVKAYNELADILEGMPEPIKLPKVKYGQKHKGKGKERRATGPKMNVKKFKKYFTKKTARPMVIFVYGHIVARLLGLEVATDDYNSWMKTVAKAIISPEFTKNFIKAAGTWAKSIDAHV